MHFRGQDIQQPRRLPLSSTRGLQGVLLDQYGVLHDGKKAYPGAVAAVEALAAAGRKLLVLSNSSRREAPCQRAHQDFHCATSTASPALTCLPVYDQG